MLLPREVPREDRTASQLSAMMKCRWLLSLLALSGCGAEQVQARARAETEPAFAHDARSSNKLLDGELHRSRHVASQVETLKAQLTVATREVERNRHGTQPIDASPLAGAQVRPCRSRRARHRIRNQASRDPEKNQSVSPIMLARLVWSPWELVEAVPHAATQGS